MSNGTGLKGRMSDITLGFEPHEVLTGEPTRSARLKWVVVVDRDLPAGRVANAVACVAAAISPGVPGLIGPGGHDASGSPHAGLPWAGVAVLGADAATLRRLRADAVTRDDVLVADMPLAAQEARVYNEFLARLAEQDPDDVAYAAVSLIGPRKRVDRLVGGLRLLP